MTTEEGKRVLSRIRKIKPFIQASFTITKKGCGNPKCRCATQGPIHESALLTWKEHGKTHTIYVPVELRQEVKQWVEEGKKIKNLMAQMSNAQREFLRRRKKSIKNKKP